jgi:hypothetical protein
MDYLDLFCETCNREGDILEVLENWDRTLRFTITELEPLYIQSRGGKIRWWKASPDEWDTEFVLNRLVFDRVLQGYERLSTAFLSKSVEVHGAVSDLARFEHILGLFNDAVNN